jgi:hypothetical protein
MFTYIDTIIGWFNDDRHSHIHRLVSCWMSSTCVDVTFETPQDTSLFLDTNVPTHALVHSPSPPKPSPTPNSAMPPIKPTPLQLESALAFTHALTCADPGQGPGLHIYLSHFSSASHSYSDRRNQFGRWFLSRETQTHTFEVDAT